MKNELEKLKLENAKLDNENRKISIESAQYSREANLTAKLYWDKVNKFEDCKIRENQFGMYVRLKNLSKNLKCKLDIEMAREYIINNKGNLEDLLFMFHFGEEHE